MEGYLFPDTYTFYVDSDPESVCMKIYQNFENKITQEHYNQMQKKGMTDDTITPEEYEKFSKEEFVL